MENYWKNYNKLVSNLQKKYIINLYKPKKRDKVINNDTYEKSHDTEWHSCLPSASDIWSWT